LYAAPEDADVWNPDTWLLANPAIGDFRSREDVERQAAQARLVPSKEATFRNLILNQRIASVSRFIHRAEWDACAGVVDLASLAGRDCYGGLDLGATRDLTAFVMVFPCADGSFDVIPHFFMPADNIAERSSEDRVPYDLWAKQGLITLIPGATIDPGFIADAIAEASRTYNLVSLAYDRWRIEDLRRELGFAGVMLPLVPHGQGFKDFAPAVDLLERCVAERLLRHGGHAVLKMCAANAVITRNPAGDRKLDKEKAPGRIDGLVALAMALSTSKRHEPEALPACLMELIN
jgi:phage terminase large subunit-like protein